MKNDSTPLDVLINNVGSLSVRREETTDGFETTFATNHLAPFLLTRLLAEMLLRSAPAREIITSSLIEVWARLDFDDPMMESSYSGFKAYAASKLANILFTRELA